MSTASRRKGTTPKKANKVEISFSNWMMGGSLVSLSTTSSLGSRVSSKGSGKSFNIDTDDDEPPDPTPPAPVKASKKKEVPVPEPKKAEEKSAVCVKCGPEPEPAKCALNCPICSEECAWEKHMVEKYGFMECDTCGRGPTWLKEEFHRGRGEYACEKCMPDCTTCGRGPLWLSKKWQKTVKRRARKLQGVGKDTKKDSDGKKKTGDDVAKKTKDSGRVEAKEKEKGEDKEKEKEKEKNKTEDKSAEKEKESSATKDNSGKKGGGKGNKGAHDWTSEEDAKLKEMKAQNKPWNKIASEVGVNVGLCKARFKDLENTKDTTTEKKDETSSGDKQNAGEEDAGDGFLGGFGDWNNDDSNKKTNGSGGNGNNQSWGAAEPSNTTGAVNDGWGSSNNNNQSNANADTTASAGDNDNSGWGANNSSKDATASGGDQPSSSWDNTNGTSGNTGNSGWGFSNDANVSGGEQASSSWDNANGTSGVTGNSGFGGVSNTNVNHKDTSANKGKGMDLYADLIGEITASNPTGYKPYKSSYTAGGGATGSFNQNDNTASTGINTSKASGGSPKAGNAETSGNGWGTASVCNAVPDTSNNNTSKVVGSGSGWEGPKTDWVIIDPSDDNAGDGFAKRDPWIQPVLSKDSDADNHRGYTTTGSNHGCPIERSHGTGWGQNQYGGASNTENKHDFSNQNSGNWGDRWGQGGKDNNNHNNANDSSSRPNAWNNSHNQNFGAFHAFNQGNQKPGNRGDRWGQGDNNNHNNNNADDSSSRPNAWNSSHDPNYNAFNQANNGGGGSNNPNNFNLGGPPRGNQSSRGRLRADATWSQADCTFLEFLEARYHHKWEHIQADFYNWSHGRMIPAELIERKFRDDGYSM